MEFIIRVLLYFGGDMTHNTPFLTLRGVRELGLEKALARVVFYLVILWNAEEVIVMHDHQVIQPSMENVHLDDV